MLEEFRSKVEDRMQAKDKEMQNRINELEIEKDTALSAARSAELLLESSKLDLEAAEIELSGVKEREEEMRRQMQIDYDADLKVAEENYRSSLELIEQHSEAQVRL